MQLSSCLSKEDIDMKKQLLICAVMSSAAIFAADAPNLLKNPGFEKTADGTTPADWTMYRDGALLSEDNIQENGGRYCLSLSGSKVNRGIYQNIYAGPGEKFRLSMDLLLSRFEAGKILPFYATVQCAGQKTRYIELLVLTPDKASVSPEYRKLAAELDLRQYPEATGTFGIWCLTMDFTGDMYIDNFKVEKIPRENK